ncbi:hypothetical protein SISSUDRAFT_1046288 [Sistotremastrum suecicum HHB10207 ss-3]|uniref:Asl1-like glycosyl hydrolase catalytic domain-containing protein n=1 Tax=Sistotremastrum suecicum HHB10207 ss-3 TaxID=1314776 RepID=A0A166DWH9_9AGAM|nr:hypothetical protein SISSUDRAFT_1046288 [Sistotremastrum suecicum HHB10207 ss-3]
MAVSRFFNLVALSCVALFLCSFGPEPVAALSSPDSLVLPRHMARGHGAIAAKRKRAANKSKRCKTRPTSSDTSSTATSTSTTSSSSSTQSHSSSSSSSSKPKSTPASAPASVSVNTGGGGGKFALAWPNGDSGLQSWKGPSMMYTWTPACPDSAKALGIGCAPMLWGWNQVSQFQSTVKPGYSNIAMAINEPNEPGQSNMSPESGAQLWKQYVEPLRSQGYELVSPVTSSNPNGFTWVQNWLTACDGGCNFDRLALHWYDTTLGKFQDYINKWHTAFPDKKIWITEYACVNFNGGAQPSDAEIAAFHAAAIPYLNSLDYVEYIFPFGAMKQMDGVDPANQLMDPVTGEPNALGWTYLALD